jgi:hypothetical protein
MSAGFFVGFGDDDGEGFAARQGVMSAAPSRSVMAQVTVAVRANPEAEEEWR